MSAQRRLIVLGATSAIAEATCRLLAAEGAAFALVGRGQDRLESIAADLKVRGAGLAACVTQDLAEATDAAAVLARCAEKLGGVDGVLIFYGVLGDQKTAETDLAAAKALLDVNFTSAALWAIAAANHLEAQGAGTLLAVSSVAGDRGRRSNFVYGAAKGGLSVLMQGIAHRFGAKPGGPRAVNLKLGFVDTPMTAHVPKGGPLWATPDMIAPIIAGALDRGGPVVYAPWFWRWIMLAIRMTPQVIFNRVNL